MFFRCAKLLQFFLRPSNAILLLVVVSCLLLLLGWFALGSLILLIATIAAIVLAWTPVPYWLLRPLESRYPVFDLRQLDLTQSVRGIILLGGGINASRGDRPNGPIFTSAGSRLFVALELAQLFPQASILLSGGVPDLLADKSYSEAGLTRDLLIRLGYKQAFTESLAEVARKKPHTAIGTGLTDIGRRLVPGLEIPNVCDLLLHAPFES